jgi:aspartyl-tRNA(Asn)/glutamyl-tRNA(Gln) amidotransferase subunit A
MTHDQGLRTKDQGPLTIHAAAEALRTGALTPVDLFDQCLARIDRYESRVRAWVVVDRDGAREQAVRLTDELKRGQDRGPLHGIPVGVKDIIDVFDLPTGCGSKLWANSIARRDATVVERLRQAGAVILGKTVTTAYAFLDPPVTRNPWDPARTPGGSSSGSAAAVACGTCLGALGSQTGGSTTRPAAFCGVASCKPSWGRVSVAGVLPLAPSLDHVGVMANGVHDLAALLQAVAGPDLHDPAASRRTVPDLRAARPPEPLRVGRLRGPFEQRAEPAMRSLLDKVCEQLAESGAAVRDVAAPAAFAEVLPRHRTLMAAGAAAYHGPRLRRHPDDYPPKIRELVEEGLSAPAAEVIRSLELRSALLAAFEPLFGEWDVLLTPAAVGPAPDRCTTGDAAFNAPWSFLGLPTVGLPAGWSSEELPMAVQLVGPAFGEAGLLAAAAWCEARLGLERRLPPVPA